MAVVKNQYQEPSLPTDPADVRTTADEAGDEPGGREEGRQEAKDGSAVPDEQVREVVATLFRVIRSEPRLRLGEAEARTLAPLVAQWQERGATQADLTAALLPGLPTPLHSPAAVIRNRLERKMPPQQTPVCPASARYDECAMCHDPVPQAGICRPCAGLGARTPAVGGGEASTRSGAARARAALLAAKSVGLGLTGLATTG